MRKDLAKIVRGILFGTAMLVVLSACASATGAASSAPSVPETSASAPSAALPANAPPAMQPADRPGDLLSQGKLIFEKTAGGMGCAVCHGLDAKGAGPAGVNAPDIRGKNEGDVRAAISGGVPMMTGVIKLSDDEITAVAAYLQYLSQQPRVGAKGMKQ